MPITRSISSFFYRFNRKPSNAVEEPSRQRKAYLTGTLDTDMQMTSFLSDSDKRRLRRVSRNLNQTVFGPLVDNIVYQVREIPLKSKVSEIMNQVERGICGFDATPSEESHFFSSIVVSDDSGNRTILTSDSYGTIRIRNYETGLGIRKFINKRRDYGHYPLLITPCKKKLVIGFPTGCIKVICIDTGTEFLTLTGHTRGIDVLAISKCGQFLASASFNGSIRIWDLIESKQIFITNTCPGKFRFLEISPCGRMLLTVSTDTPARVWSLETGRCLYRVPFYSQGLTALAITPCGKKLIAGFLDGSIKIWDLHPGNGIGYGNTFREWNDQIFPCLKSIFAVKILSCGKKFVTVNYAGVIKIWNLENDVRCISVVNLRERISFFSMSPCGKHFFTMDSSALKVKTWAMEEVLLCQDDA